MFANFAPPPPRRARNLACPRFPDGLSVGCPRQQPHRAGLARSCLFAQSCPTLCGPVDCGPAGSSGLGVFQARTLGGLPFPPLLAHSRDSLVCGINQLASEGQAHGKTWLSWAGGGRSASQSRPRAAALAAPAFPGPPTLPLCRPDFVLAPPLLFAVSTSRDHPTSLLGADGVGAKQAHRPPGSRGSLDRPTRPGVLYRRFSHWGTQLRGLYCRQPAPHFPRRVRQIFSLY